MKPDLRLSAAVFAGLVWIFVVNLFIDLLSSAAVATLWIVPPLVALTMRLPLRATLVCLALVALLHDATLPVPFGITASVALPAAACLHGVRRHLNTRSRRQAAAVAFAISPTLHITTVLAMAAAGCPLPQDAAGLAIEIAAGTLVAAIATPWLANLTDAMLRAFGFADDAHAA